SSASGSTILSTPTSSSSSSDDESDTDNVNYINVKYYQDDQSKTTIPDDQSPTSEIASTSNLIMHQNNLYAIERQKAASTSNPICLYEHHFYRKQSLQLTRNHRPKINRWPV